MATCGFSTSKWPRPALFNALQYSLRSIETMFSAFFICIRLATCLTALSTSYNCSAFASCLHSLSIHSWRCRFVISSIELATIHPSYMNIWRSSSFMVTVYDVGTIFTFTFLRFSSICSSYIFLHRLKPIKRYRKYLSTCMGCHSFCNRAWSFL